MGRGTYPIAVGLGSRDIEALKAEGFPVAALPQFPEAPGHGGGGFGILVLPKMPPHPNAARVFVNWLLSREGQIALQRTANTPTNSEESLRTDIPKDMVRSEVRRVDGVKYILVDKPEYMDMAPIQDIVEKALAQAKKR